MGDEFDVLVEDIRKKGLILPIILYDGMIIDGKNRYRACLKVNVGPMFMDYKGSLSPIDLVTSLNDIRRHSSPAKKAETARRIMEFLRDEDEDAKLEEALKDEDEATKEKVKFVREKKKILNAAGMAGTSSETMKQSIVIGEVAQKHPEIAKQWEEAKKGKRSVSSVYKEAIKKQKELEERSSELKQEEEESKDKRPILVQVNEKLRADIKDVREEVKEWKAKYHNLKAAYESLEQKHKSLKNQLKNVFESVGLDVVPAKKESAFPKPKELREAGLKY